MYMLLNSSHSLLPLWLPKPIRVLSCDRQSFFGQSNPSKTLLYILYLKEEEEEEEIIDQGSELNQMQDSIDKVSHAYNTS